MSNITQRIEKLERRISTNNPRVFIIHKGERIGKCDGVPMSLDEFEQNNQATDIQITIVKASDMKARIPT